MAGTLGTGGGGVSFFGSSPIWMYFCTLSVAWVCNTAFIQMMLPASVHKHTLGTAPLG